MQFFCGEQRKSLREIEAGLRPKNGERARTGPVRFWVPAFEYEAQEIVVLTHGAVGKRVSWMRARREVAGVAPAPLQDCRVAVQSESA